MPFWFLDKKTNKPNIYGSLVALSDDNDIDIKILYDHFSLPSNIFEFRRLESIIKRLTNSKTEIKPKYFEYIFNLNERLNNEKISLLEKKLYIQHSAYITNKVDTKAEKMSIVFAKRDIGDIDTKHMALNVSNIGGESLINRIETNSKHPINKPTLDDIHVELNKHIKKYNIDSDKCIFHCVYLRLSSVETRLYLDAILSELIKIEAKFEKKYNSFYEDERYRFHKKNIIRS